MFNLKLSAHEIFHLISVLKADANLHTKDSAVPGTLQSYWREEGAKSEALAKKLQEAMKK